MAPLLRGISPSCPRLQHQRVVPEHWQEGWWIVWAAWWGWTGQMRREEQRKPLSYGQQVNLWMPASGGQQGLWVLHPGSSTREQWNLLVEGDLWKADATVSCDFLLLCFWRQDYTLFCILPDGFAALGRLRVVGFGRFIFISSPKSKPHSKQVT